MIGRRLTSRCYRCPDGKVGDGGVGAQPAAGVADQEFEDLLLRAMRVDVPDFDRTTSGVPVQRRSRKPLWFALAATVVLGIGLSINVLRDSAFLSTGDIAQDVVVHVRHEDEAAFARSTPVPRRQLNGVLQAAGATMGPVGDVSYVKLCPFRGTMVAHFVVQESAGPVTVLLLPDEEVSGPVMIEEEGIIGTIVGLETGGSIAVVGSSGEEIEDIKNRVAAAVKWRL